MKLMQTSTILHSASLIHLACTRYHFHQSVCQTNKLQREKKQFKEWQFNYFRQTVIIALLKLGQVTIGISTAHQTLITFHIIKLLFFLPVIFWKRPLLFSQAKLPREPTQQKIASEMRDYRIVNGAGCSLLFYPWRSINCLGL